MKHYFAALLLAALPGLASAQHYFQQEVNYKIEVSLNDQTHELTGSEEIEYVNNSPDRLSYIYFHLWPNAYKNNKTAFAQQMARNNSRNFHFAEKQKRGYIDGLAFEVNGKPVKLEYEQPDVAKLILNEPLSPGQRILIRTPFRVKIPGAFSRLGHVEQSYQISQWYPKPAVYDRKGWHPMPYLDQGEFYSEFGKFDVKITLPANYNVGATGMLQTASEIARMDSLAEVSAAKKSFGTDMSFPPSSAKTKTLHYVQDRIHDFAWFADKRFNVLKSEVELPQSKRKVTTWLLFLNRNAPGWLARKNDLNTAISKYSELVGEYPYAAATAVDAALGENVGGMEYPMVTVTTPSAIIHEVGHNWFYGILGSNEREHPWLDEGLNCYIENRTAAEKDSDAGMLSGLLEPPLRRILGLEEVNANALNYAAWLLTNSRGADQPIEFPSEHYTKTNYAGIVYLKTPAAFTYLETYLGRDRFDKAMHAYYEKWKFTHPYPENLQAVFEEVSGEKLDWFFKDLLQTTELVDIGIKKVEKTIDGYRVTLKNEGKFAAPAPVAAINEAGEITKVQWTKPFTGEETLTFIGVADRFEVDPAYLLPETDRRDNQMKTTGLLPKSERLALQPLAGLEQNRKKQLYFLPVIGANTADKLMLGVALYNSSVQAKKVNYLLMPMYSFHQNEVNGIGNINYNFVPHGSRFLRQAILGFNFQRFEYFRKYEPSLTFNFKRATVARPRQQLKIAITSINHEKSKINPILEHAEIGSFFPLLHQPEKIGGQTLTYTIWQTNAVQKAGLELQFQHLGSNPKASDNQSNALRGTAFYERYWSKHKSAKARLFGGKFFTQGEQPFYMGLSGSPDYLKETIFLDRAQKSESIRALVDQTDLRDGAFKNFIPAFTDNWLTTLNLETELPFVPLSVYLDLGKMADVDEVFYGTGLALNIGKGFFSLYLPVAGSNFAGDTPENFKDFRRNIRFSLQLNKFNPFKLLNEGL
ncbi:M1 family metallopeptidase [Adhaeribacter soli]|uniref:M1 family metallopeptidase n=1 Tax=Adhaeribacter soli TaxID=2607655 RepID=A0A5N1IWK1_9BACT|nr:M1 family metallopeptidase [Adhaeribacter soli]KAA9333526.1 M1 family metallopeptidase [Adhaeribacter soli]